MKFTNRISEPHFEGYMEIHGTYVVHEYQLRLLAFKGWKFSSCLFEKFIKNTDGGGGAYLPNGED